jgi:hypothetical protein
MENGRYEISSKSIAIAICVLICVYFGWSLLSKSSQLAKEDRLLFVGNQYRAAIGRYYESSPGAIKQYPRSLEDLMEDARTRPKNQYIAELYPDPFGEKEWGFLRSPDGGIMGVHSLSEESPVNRSEFDLENEAFTGKTKYTDWIFQYRPKIVVGQVNLPLEREEPKPPAWPPNSIPSPNTIIDAKSMPSEPAVTPVKPMSRMIPPLAGQIDVSAIQMGSGVPGIPPLANETDHRRRICIVNATRYASTCAHHPDHANSPETVRECVIEAQQRYEQCTGV